MTTRDRSDGTFSCVEETVLVHEIGHAVIGDADHTDPRWMEMDGLSEEAEQPAGLHRGRRNVLSHLSERLAAPSRNPMTQQAPGSVRQGAAGPGG